MTARPLILIAGWGHPGKAMRPLKEALEEYQGQVTSTGELWQTTPAAALPCSPGLSRYAAGLRNLLASFGGRAVVIGWSMGGIVALEAACKHPELFQRLVIISGTARFGAGSGDPPGVSAIVLRAMALGLRRTPDHVLSAYYDQVYAPQPFSMVAPAMRARDAARPDCDELLQGLDYLQRTDLRASLNQLAVPAMVVHGREDRIVPWQAGEWLGRALDSSHWLCYDGLGHALPIQAAPRLAADVRAFLGDTA